MHAARRGAGCTAPGSRPLLPAVLEKECAGSASDGGFWRTWEHSCVRAGREGAGHASLSAACMQRAALASYQLSIAAGSLLLTAWRCRAPACARSAPACPPPSLPGWAATRGPTAPCTCTAHTYTMYETWQWLAGWQMAGIGVGSVSISITACTRTWAHTLPCSAPAARRTGMARSLLAGR